MIRVVTRKSLLARTQTKLVVQALSRVFPDESFKIIPLVTEVDNTYGLLHGKGSFVKELESALLTGFADFAVHSLKDMSVLDHPDLTVAACLAREEPRDVFLSREYSCLESLPAGSLVGTSSARRCAQLALRYPKVRTVHCRGNIDTRIARAVDNKFSGLLLAGAGLERLNMHNMIAEYLPVDRHVPSCAQGAIAVQCRSKDITLRAKLRKINHKATEVATGIERKIVSMLGAQCHCPLGVHASFLSEKKVRVYVMLAYEDGEKPIFEQVVMRVDDDYDVDMQLHSLIKRLMEKGADDILCYYQSLEY